MRKIVGFRASASLGAVFLAGMVAGSAAAAESGKEYAIYCLIEYGGEEIYNSAVFQSSKDDRDEWKWEWYRHLIDIGIRKDLLKQPHCRAWRGEGALESAREAAAKPTGDYRSIRRFDWAPQQSSSASPGSHSSRSTPVPRQLEQAVSQTPAKPVLAPSKYVEVTGPDVKSIRLSPEVAARNKAAEQAYQHKIEEYERKTRAHAEMIAQAERDAAQNVARAAAEKRAYEQKLALNEAQVAAHGVALGQYKAATRPPAKGAKGWMYCDARGAPGDKRRFYSRVTEIDYVPGEVTIIDVMAKNRPAFKSYVAGAHSIFFATDSLLHCPYSTTSLTDAEALMARDKRGDGNEGIEIVETGWVPTS